MRSVELFTGAGGLAIGSHFAGFEHALLAEWNKDACETLRENAARAALPGTSSWNVVQGDVRTIRYGDLGTIDLVAGGVPCQPFSPDPRVRRLKWSGRVAERGAGGSRAGFLATLRLVAGVEVGARGRVGG